MGPFHPRVVKNNTSAHQPNENVEYSEFNASIWNVYSSVVCVHVCVCVCILMFCHGQYELDILLGKRHVTYVGEHSADDIVFSIKTHAYRRSTYSQTSNSTQIMFQTYRAQMNEVANSMEAENTLCVFMYQNV